MQDWIRLAHTVRFIPSDDLESQMLIEPESLVVVFVHIHLVDLFLADGILYQSLPVSLSLFVGVYKQHLDQFITQSHECGNLSVRVADDKERYCRQIVVAYQWLIELDTLFCQEVVRGADRLLPQSYQFVVILVRWGVLYWECSNIHDHIYSRYR